MYAPERQQAILRLARESGRVDVLSLAEEFQVTAETVRRDLKTLDRAGLLRRVHGGAIPAGRLDFEPDLAERDAVAIDEKERIAAAALGELPTDGSVIIDAAARPFGLPRSSRSTPTSPWSPMRCRSPPGSPTTLASRCTLSAAVSGTVPAPPSTPGR